MFVPKKMAISFHFQCHHKLCDLASTPCDCPTIGNIDLIDICVYAYLYMTTYIIYL